MNAKEIINWAKDHFIQRDGFFATLALNMEFIEDPSIPTMCTNGEYIKYNPTFTESISKQEVVGVICHECMHPALFHHTREEGRNHDKWNRATDYAINLIITDAGYQLPKGVLLDEKYRGMEAETIYNLLPDEPEKGNWNIGGVEPLEGLDEAGKKDQEDKIKEMLVQARSNGKRQGNMTKSIEELIGKLLEPVVDWREVLARFLSEPERNDYSFRKRNPRFSKFYLPCLYNETVANVVFFRDTSISIDNEIVTEITSEVQDVSNTFQRSFTMVDIDTEVQKVMEVEPDGDVNMLRAEGRGGTDFVPGFEWITANGLTPAAVVYLTDGFCNSYPDEPEYPVLWMVYNNDNFNPPWGEVIKVK